MGAMTRSILAVVIAVTATLVFAQSLSLDQLIGTWDLTYDMGQGQQSGTIAISSNDDGTPKITMSTTGGGDSEASNIEIDGDTLKFTREVSAQGQGLAVNYEARLVDGKLDGSFEVDLSALGGAGAAGGLGGPTEWTATKAE
jgi:hypothetical protein